MSTQNVTPPEDYVNWRESQGFNTEEGDIELLWKTVDSKNIDELKVILESSRIGNGVDEKLFKTISVMQLAQRRLLNRGEKHTLEAHFLILAVNGNLNISLDLAKRGYYTSGMVLMRSAIERLLRVFFNAIKNKEHLMKSHLEKIKWKRVRKKCKCGDGHYTENKYPDWGDALKVEKGLTLGQMCIILDKMKFTKPLKDTYRFMRVKELNSITHQGIMEIVANDLNHFNQSKRNYDEEKWNEINDYIVRYNELVLIFWQNFVDIIDPRLEPIIFPNKDPGTDIFPKYSELAFSRTF